MSAPVDTSDEAVEALARRLDAAWSLEIERAAATLRALAAERDALRAALEVAALWHEEQAKALSKQPQNGETPWRRMLHREQINNIRAALKGTTP